MDIAVISCQECFFSQRAEGHLKRFFENLVGADRQKLDISWVAFLETSSFSFCDFGLNLNK